MLSKAIPLEARSKLEHYRVLLSLRPSTLSALLLVCICAIAVYIYIANKKAKLLPHVPIVGVEDRKSLASARQRFVYHAQNMISEGYQKVSGHPVRTHPSITATECFKEQWRVLLHSKSNGRAFNDSAQVYRRAQELAG